MKQKLTRNVKLYILTNLLLSFSSGLFGMFAGIYLKELHYSEGFVGQMLAYHTFSTAVFSLLGTFLIGQIGRKRSLLIGSLVIAAGLYLMVQVDSSFLLLSTGVISGFGFSMKSTAEAMFLAENSPPAQRVLVFSLNFTAMNLGMASATFFGGFLSDYFANFMSQMNAVRLVVTIGAGIALLSFVPILLIEEKFLTAKRNVSEYLNGYKTILGGNRTARHFLWFNAIVGMGAGMIVPFFSVYLKYSLHISDGAAGRVLTFAQLGTVLGGLLIPFIAKRLGDHRSVVVCQILSIPFLLSIAFPQGLLIVALSFFFRSSLMNMSSPITQNLAMQMVHPLDRAHLSSLMSLANNLPRALGVFVGGYLMQHVNYTSPYYFTVFFYIVATILFVQMFKKELFPKAVA